MAGGFAAERPAGKRYRSIAGADAQQQQRRSTVLSSKCEQCHVDTRETRPNTNLLKKENAADKQTEGRRLTFAVLFCLEAVLAGGGRLDR